VVATHVEPVDEQGAVEPDGTLRVAAKVKVGVTGYFILDNQATANNPGPETLIVGQGIWFPPC